jgi:hypothetical protein
MSWRRPAPATASRRMPLGVNVTHQRQEQWRNHCSMYQRRTGAEQNPRKRGARRARAGHAGAAGRCWGTDDQTRTRRCHEQPSIHYDIPALTLEPENLMPSESKWHVRAGKRWGGAQDASQSW